MKLRFSLSTNIFIGLVLGIACGLFFGEYCADLKVIGNGFVRLLQMTILPYIIVSLVLGFGKLSFSDAKRLAFRGSILLLIFWALGLLIVLVMPFTFPPLKSGSFFSTSMVAPPKNIDYLSLYIPSNPFYSMANNIIPAVVFFSICVGIGLIGIKNKEYFLKDLAIISQALTRVTHVIVNLTPIGVFAISAGAAGTMTIGEFEKLQVYFIVYILAAVLMTFFILPLFIMALTPFKYRDIVNASKDALMTGFTTGNLFICLPVVEANIKELFRKYDEYTGETESLIDIVTPVYFNFPDTGKLLSLIFILFAAWFSGTPMSLLKYPEFAFTGFFTFFGGADIAIPYLLNYFQLHSDLFQLYIVGGILNGRFSTLLAVMDLFAFTLLCTGALTGVVRLKPHKILIYSLIALLGTAGIIVASKFAMHKFIKSSSDKEEILLNMKVKIKAKEKVMVTIPGDLPKRNVRTPIMKRIAESGVLRVAYNMESLPFSFFNNDNELVGYDVSVMHKLASELGCSLLFLPFKDSREMEKGLYEGISDIGISGVAMTTDRLKRMDFSQHYMTLTIGFLVKDYRKDDFSSFESVRKMKNFRLAVLKNSLHIRRIKEVLPNAQIVTITSRNQFFHQKKISADAMLISAEEGSAWTLIYPYYTVAIPKPLIIKVNVGYCTAKGQLDFISFLSRWLEVQRVKGFLKKRYEYWILGKHSEEKKPRWCIIRNILHWGGKNEDGESAETIERLQYE